MCPWLTKGRPQEPRFAITLKQAISKTMEAKRSSGLRPLYLKSLDRYLRRFSKGREDAYLNSIHAEQIESYLSAFSLASKHTHLRRIGSLFAYAERRGWIKANPCRKIERPRLEHRTPRILTPDEALKVVELCPKNLKPYLAAALYCGIRPTEAMRLDWRNVNLEAGIIIIDASVSKVRSRRVVNIAAPAAKILAAHRKESGRLTPSLSTVRRWTAKLSAQLGWFDHDCFRHTAASYMLALHQDAGKVALQLGNSPSVLLTHYNGLASKSDAERFYCVAPICKS